MVGSRDCKSLGIFPFGLSLTAWKYPLGFGLTGYQSNNDTHDAQAYQPDYAEHGNAKGEF